ncbi:MAG: archaetidylserine decarboxylase [Acidobacteriota bacterium]
MSPRLSLPQRGALIALRLLPKQLLSRLAGQLASFHWPPPLHRVIVGSFARAVGADLAEADEPLSAHRSIQEFFVRRLRPGVRPLDPDPRALTSPCDGAWGEAGRVRDGAAVQAKGRLYRIDELLGEDARRFEGGAFATLYLSPRDYHRFHAPTALEIERVRYLPGELWPVNRLGVEGVEALFARNERLVIFGRVQSGEGNGGEVAIVAVGATMVGTTRLAFDDVATRTGRAAVRERRYAPAHALARGGELGRFEFGSTLVLVAEPSVLAFDRPPEGGPVRCGRRIGWLAGD